MVSRNVRFHAQGEFVLVRLVQGESTSPGGVILVDHEKADLLHGVIQSIGDKINTEPKYGPKLEVGQLVMFSAKAGVKIDAKRKIISIDDVLLASDAEPVVAEADTEPPPTEGTNGETVQ